MMPRHRDLPRAGRKQPSLHSALRSAHVRVALIAVSLAGVALTLLSAVALHVYAKHNLNLIARSMAYTVEAAVVFRDDRATAEALAQITASEPLAQASVYDNNDNLLASWTRSADGTFDSVETYVSRLIVPPPVRLPIMHDGRTVGHLELTAHGGSLVQFLLRGLLALVFCLVISAISAIYLAGRMVETLTSPLRELADVAHAARTNRSFNQRVTPGDIAELNQLGRDFNALLDEVETWQSRLQDENASLAYKASHDSLTGLPNRDFFEAKLAQAILHAQAHGTRVAVLFLDCNQFKRVNDTFGHAAGDRVLIDIANRARRRVRETDLVARLGGDEFAIMITPLANEQDAINIAQSIIDGMHPPVPLLDGSHIPVSLSIGVALFPDHARTPDELVRAADTAMYRAKQKSRKGGLAVPAA